MITTEEYKSFLKAKGYDLPDENVKELLDKQYQLANIFFDMWVKKTKQPTIICGTILTRKKDGNCISVDTFSFLHIYA